jgi:ubiquinone/menaquinone biosynthesis C-methylase UbiE
VVAALDHLAALGWGPPSRSVRVLEVGAGTGEASPVVRARFPQVVVTDVSWPMLRQVDPAFPRVVADVRRLPLATGSVDLLVGLNAVPGAAEFRRVLSPTGRLVWCTSFGPHTPLYVDPEELARHLGPEWHGVARRAAAGDWCLLQSEEVA